MSAKKFAKAYLEITNICNLHCSFCHGTARKKEFMPPDRFRAFATAIRPHTDYLYLHILGEPLLHPQFEELLRIAASMGFRLCITTNGTLLPERQELLLRYASHIHKVSVSLHASEANGESPRESYLRGCVSFASKASEQGVIVALRLWNLEGEAVTPSQNTANGGILTLLHGSFPQAWTETRNGYKLAPRVYLEWGETFDWPDMAAPDYGEEGFCYGLRDQFGVLVDGTVVPCCLDAEGNIPLGNLQRDPLSDILEGRRARSLCEGFDQRRVREALCRRCGYRRRF